MKNKNRNIMTIIGILILFIVITYTAYAIFNATATTDPSTISTGNVIMSFTEGDTVSLDTNGATSDTEGKAQTNYFEFALSSTAENKLKLAYYIYAVPDTNNTIDSKYVKVYLSKSDNNVETDLINPTLFSALTRFNTTTMAVDNTANNYLIYSNAFDFNSSATLTNQFRLRLWLDSTYPTENPNITNTDNGQSGASHSAQIASSKTFKFKIHVYSEQGDVKL